MVDGTMVAVRRVSVRLDGERAPHALMSARVTCRRGGSAHRGDECYECRRFVSWHFGPEDGQLTIHCRWTGADPVGALMTGVHVLQTVSPLLTVREADARARASGVRHLPVIQRGRLAGMTCRCDFVGAEPGARVCDVMSRRVVTITPTTTVDGALDAMARARVGALPVVVSGPLLGIVTRGDLRRVGFPEERLGAERCGACASPHGVRATRDGGAPRCLACLEASR